jgi:hypothetical protein
MRVPFEKDISATDLYISGLFVKPDASDLVFTLEYRTGRDRFLSFFDPPSGEEFMHVERNGLREEGKSVSFRIPASIFAKMPRIAMRFSTNQNAEADRNFLYLRIDDALMEKLASRPAEGNRVEKEAVAADVGDTGGYSTSLNANGELGIARRLPPSDYSRDAVRELPSFDADSGQAWQIDLRSRDASAVDARGRLDDLLHASFDSRTTWPEELAVGFDPGRIMELGKDPGLGVSGLHAAGITGSGVGIAIIDQGLLANHAEYRDRLKLYEEIHCVDSSASMHGAAVASIAVGETVGVAPRADLYYIAETHGVYREGSFDWDLSWLAKSIDRIVEINASLPSQGKIRVISVSLGISAKLRNGDMALEAIRRAKERGIYTVYVGSDSFFGLGREPNADPDAVGSYLPGGFLAKSFYAGRLAAKIGIPMDSRCAASPTGAGDYAFYPEGGMSWTVPYVAGLFALACQARPDLTPELFWEAAEATGDFSDIVKDGKEYRLAMIVSPARLIEYLRTGQR